MENSSDNTKSFFRFEELRVYEKSLKYICFVDEVTQLFPDENQDLKLKFRSYARDISISIAEGSTRNINQFIFYLKLAKSAIRNCLVYTTIAYRNNILTEENNDYSRNELIELTKMLGAMIRSFQDNRSGKKHIKNSNINENYNSN